MSMKACGTRFLSTRSCPSRVPPMTGSCGSSIGTSAADAGQAGAMQPDSYSPARLGAAGYLLAAAALLLVLALHLLPALFAGLLVFALVNALASGMQRHLPGAG